MMLTCGMDEETFWFGNPKLIKSYLIKYEMEKTYDNEFAWKQGAYIYNAISTSLANAFSDKSSKTLTYFEKPIEEFDYIIEERQNIVESTESNQKVQYNYWAKYKQNIKDSMK